MKASDFCQPGQGCLIRHWNASGRLLYVGRSMASNATWRLDIAEITIERFPTKRLAADAETIARAVENPTHNAGAPEPTDV